jgi:hypothetical protein
MADTTNGASAGQVPTKAVRSAISRGIGPALRVAAWSLSQELIVASRSSR